VKENLNIITRSDNIFYNLQVKVYQV